MSFIRPEAATLIRRYGEPAVYGLLAGWGIWHGITMLGRGAWSGVLLVALGALALLGLVGAAERALAAWRGRRAGPGTVEIKEGQIAYFGPLGGAILALDALVAVDIRTTAPDSPAGDLFWVLRDEIGQIVEIPGGADGSVALLDRLGSLPGFDHRAVFSAMSTTSRAHFRIWRRTPQASLSSS